MTHVLARRIGATVMAAMLVTALAACGGGGSDSPTATLAVPATAPATATTAAAATPTAGTSQAPSATAPAQTTATTAASEATTTTATGVATATTSSGPTPTTDAALDAVLSQTALALTDMPEDWTEQPTDSSSDSDTGLCGKPDFERKGNKLGEHDVTFTGGDFGPVVVQNLTAFPEADAADAMAYARDSATCTDWTETDAEGVATTYSLAPLDMPTFGDESIAVRISYDDPNLGTVITDTVYLRVGTLLSAIGYISLNAPDLDQFQALITTAVQKMQAAELP